MAIIRINPDNIERYTLVANPRRTFSSASNTVSSVVTPGITGTLPLFADNTSVFKDIGNKNPNSQIYSDDSIESFRDSVVSAMNSAIANSTTAFPVLDAYLNNVNALTSSAIYDKRQSVIRFEPGLSVDNPDFQRKQIVRDILFPFYRGFYPSLQYSYTNYHTLNFVTSSYLSTTAALMYPAGTGTVDLAGSNPYAPDTSFTFDFYINPRYAEENVGEPYNAGTILHLSSCYAISLVTGSSFDVDGKKDGYRLLLQLSQSAEIPPRDVAISGDTASAPGASADSGFLFVSTDNSLKRNTWHHVSIRWGGTEVQNGTGSFVIDGSEDSTFVITSASVMAPIQSTANLFNSDVLFVGNFYEGSNTGNDAMAGFFNTTDARTHGTIVMPTPADSDPTDFSMVHPLNAEVHDLKIFNTYRSDLQILTSSVSGFEWDANYKRPGVSGSSPYLSGTSAAEGLIFFVPPFFTKESPLREVNQTPFQARTGSTDDPFNTAMSFGVDGLELNLQNFTREFVRAFYPRPYGIEASRNTSSPSQTNTANYFIYESPSNRKRNAFILPCDNGKFTPYFRTLLTGSTLDPASGSILDRFTNDFGGLDLSRIDLNNLVSTENLPKVTDEYTFLGQDGTGSILDPLFGATPENPDFAPGFVPKILQRTKDPSSNEVVFFDISNMFYGDQIKPQSVVIKDLAVTGTAGRIQVTLKDDGYGNLYRADSVSPHATWSSVGNVIYEEGIIIVKSPNLPLFGSDAWELSFEGERNIHVLEVNVLADKGLINSSSNPTYQKLIPTDNHNETAKEFVYLTGLQLHDDNLNVIARANFAQPIVKRDGDRYTVRLRMDF